MTKEIIYSSNFPLFRFMYDNQGELNLSQTGISTYLSQRGNDEKNHDEQI